MSRHSPYVIVLAAEDREHLEAVSQRLAASLRDVQRARIVLAAAEGLENVVIAERVRIDVNTVSKWRKRFFEEVDTHRQQRWPNLAEFSIRFRGDFAYSILPNGGPSGTPEQALDCACGLYFKDPTAWT